MSATHRLTVSALALTALVLASLRNASPVLTATYTVGCTRYTITKTGRGTITGDDTISANAGDHTVQGGRGLDTVCSGDGNDPLQGNEEDDLVIGGRGDDFISGNDILRVNSSRTDETFAEQASGGDGHDQLFGSSGEDLLQGDAGDDRMHGSGGDDDLNGSNGADFHSGGDGTADFCFDNSESETDDTDGTCETTIGIP